MDTCRQRFRRTTSLLVCSLLVLVVVAEVCDGHPAKNKDNWKRHSGRRVTPISITTTRRHARFQRSMQLLDAQNCTLCPFNVETDINKNRVPSIINHVTCDNEGSPCKTIENRGLWKCTQLVTDIIVTINNNQELLSNFPYACVCARPEGRDALSPEGERIED